jgi:hypothetical protein
MEEQVEEAPKPQSLAELFQKEFGLTVSVVSGDGSRASPWHIPEVDPKTAAVHAMRLLTAFGRGQQVLWRVLGTEPVEESDSVQRVVIERVRFEETEVITEKAAYYFQYEPAASGVVLITALGCTQPEASLSLPHQIGWLHYQGNSTSMPPDLAGAGYAAAYGAPGIKATIFVYPGTSPAMDNPITMAEVEEEFRIADAALTQGGGFTSAGEETRNPKKSAVLQWIWKMYFGKDGVSFLMITAIGNRFVKTRITSHSDREVFGCTMHSIAELLGVDLATRA